MTVFEQTTPALTDAAEAPQKIDFAVHNFVKIFRINPAVIDSRYRKFE
jgi:hypothetical protein